jgi:hypothetical protein
MRLDPLLVGGLLAGLGHAGAAESQSAETRIPNLVLHLSAAETSLREGTVDYADLQMLHAGLHALEYPTSTSGRNSRGSRRRTGFCSWRNRSPERPLASTGCWTF